MSRLISLAANIFLFITISTTTSFAQEEVYIDVYTYQCEPCAYMFVETGFSEDSQFSWVITYPGSQTPPLDTIEHIITNDPYLEWCGGNGAYSVFLEIIEEDGTIEFIGEQEFWIYFEDYFDVFVEGTGRYITDCEEEDFLVFNNYFSDCTHYEVCVGATTTIFLDDIFLSFDNGEDGDFDIEQTWSVSGGQVITNSSEEITVLWTEEGNGRLIIEGMYWSLDGCFQFPYGFVVCFKVGLPPPAEIITQPLPNTNGALEVCEGQTIYFTNEIEGEDISYFWDFGDGNSAAIFNPTHVYDLAGTYEVELTTSYECECVDVSTLTVIVEGNEAPFIDCTATICEGTAATYTATTVCSSYDWSISDNGIVLDGGDSTDDFITIEWGAGPIGEVILETDDCADLSTCTAAAYIQIPIISATSTIEGPQTVCRGDVSIYSLPPFEGVEFEWAVSPFGTIIAGQGTSSVTIEWYDGAIPPSAQVINVNYSNCYLECGGSATMDVFIRPEFYASGAIEVCQNASSDYSVINTQTNTSFPALFRVEDATGTVVWTSPGATTTATVNWDFGTGVFNVITVPQEPTDFCTESYSITVKVIPSPTAPDGILGQNEICPDIYYTYAVESPVDGERYHWEITNGTSITERDGSSITVSWENTEPYILRLSKLSPLLLCPSPSITLTMNGVTDFNISGDPVVCLDQLANYGNDQEGEVHYQWSILPAGAGTITGETTASTIEVLWHTSGATTVQLEICGQQEIFEVDVQTPPQPIVNAPDALCAGVTAIINTTETYAQYSWQDENGNVLSTDPTPSLGGGHYRLEVVDNIGCVGNTIFYIYPYPESEISISTPDYNAFCKSIIFTHMYAVNTEDGYTFQWLKDGVPISGETNTNYAATQYGVYHVEIVDENGCSFSSNEINVHENCSNGGGSSYGDNGGINGAALCSAAGNNFTITGGASCIDRSYAATISTNIPDVIQWNFDDPLSGALNNATGNNADHTYSKSGFYRVAMFSIYEEGEGNIVCITRRPDAIDTEAAFDYKGVCVGLPIQFYDLSTFISDFTSITDWNWDFGDPASGVNTSTDKDPIHIFTGDGSYNVTLTVTSTTGCIASVTKEVFVYPLPLTSFEEPDITCSLTALALNADVESTVSNVTWGFGDPTSNDANSSTLFNSYHTYDNTGLYNISLEATSVYGCVNSFNRDIDIISNDLTGEIDPTGLNTLCGGDSLLLTAPESVATQWNWSTGEQTQNVISRESATYTVTLTSVEGCTYTPEVVTVDIVPVPQSPISSVVYNDFHQAISYTYDSLTICQGERVFLETQMQVNYSFNWSTGDSGNTTEFSEERNNLLGVGTHTISLNIRDIDTDCEAVEVFEIIVNPVPSIPVITHASTLCAGDPTVLSVQNLNANDTYAWNNNEIGSTITTGIAGIYKVTAINTYGCKETSENVEIHEGPNVSFVPNGCHTRCAPDTLCIPEIPNVVSYQWYQDGELIPAPNGIISNLVIENSGVYTLEMEDTNGCIQTSNPLSIEVLEGYGTILGTVYFDQNENGIIDITDVVAEGIIIEMNNSTTALGDRETDDLGNYGYINIPEDDYILTIDTLSIPEGWGAQIVSVDTTIVGCDQQLEVNWLLIPVCVDTTFVASVCPGNDFVFQGQAYSIGSSQVVTLPSLTVCDSTFTFSVQGLPTSNDLLAVEICPGELYTYNGEEYAAGADQFFQYVNSAGCDSIIQLVVTATEEANIDIALTSSCSAVDNGSINITPIAGVTPFEFALNGGAFQVGMNFDALEAGSYDLVYQDGNACQYTETLIIDEIINFDTTFVVNICAGEDFIFRDQMYAIGSDQSIVISSLMTCDSTFTFSVQGLATSNDLLAAEICPGEMYTYNGDEYAAGTNQLFQYVNSAGCDSIIQLVVTATEEANIDIALTSSCSAVDNGSINITPVAGVTPFEFALNGGAFQAGMNFDALEAGSYDLVYQDGNACQYTETLIIDEIINFDTTFVARVCTGEDFIFRDQTYIIGSDQSIVISSLMACDSTFAFSVQGLPISNDLLAAEICPGEMYTYNGDEYAAGTDQLFQYVNSAGCDSIIQLVVTATEEANIDIALAASCSAVDNGSINITPVAGAMPFEFALNGGAFQAGMNFEALEAGSYDLIYQDGNACQYTETLIIDEIINFDTTFVARVCEGEGFDFLGQMYTIGSSQTVAIPSVTGCDSSFSFSVEGLAHSEELLIAQICPGEMYIYNGQAYPGGTDQSFSLMNNVGCDSTLQLMVIETEAASIEMTLENSCPNINTGSIDISTLAGATPFVFALNDGVFQMSPAFSALEASVYDLHYEDANGCAFSETISISVLPTLIVQLDDTTIPCGQESIMLQAQIHSGDDGQLVFLWNDGMTTQERPVDAFGALSLEVSNACEQQNLSVEISPAVKIDEQSIYLPNAFSPNGDGNNDVFEIYPGGDIEIESFSLQIFDRWGGLVFETKDMKKGWNGNKKSEKSDSGIYIWRMEAVVNLCGQEINLKRKGDVLLLR